MRTAQPKDMPALRKLLAEQNKRDGTNYPLPEIFRQNGSLAHGIAMALVAESNGKVIQGQIFEVGLEMCLIGCSPRATVCLVIESQAVKWTLRQLGYRWIRTLLPRVRLKQLEPPLADVGFKSDDKKFAPFFMELEQEIEQETDQ